MSFRRRGFALAELMVVVTIIGILARIALPKYQRIRIKARAAAIITDMNVIKGAAYMSLENTGKWPLDAAVGKVPTELTKLLPNGMNWVKDKSTSYDWRLTGMTGGNPAVATASTSMGMGVSTTDATLFAELQKQLAKQPTFVSGTSIYWLIWGPTTKP